MAKPKYITGIDLGTTNIVVTQIPLAKTDQDSMEEPEVFQILQEFSKGTLEERSELPSFLFERLAEKHVLPWDKDSRFLLGAFARERGEEVPARLVSSAKSWLCNPRIDRRAAILPWNGPEDALKISPLETMVEFLTHIKNAWNNQFKEKLEDQIVVLTIPASFDAVARDLTTDAAQSAGLSAVTLLEEPQAAFYSWISQSGAPWREQVKKGDVVLVVDVGGGTTDFSLIEVGESEGELSLERVAVGNHILLGGDNMDLTLAFHVKAKLEESKKKISTWQAIALSHQCRKAKELLLSDPKRKSEPIVISGRGSSVIGGTIKSSIERSDLEKILVDGFFPVCSIDDLPSDQGESGFREVNLAYATDPAITRHLAAFLNSRHGKDSYRYPQAVLFNGGVFQSSPFRDRLVETINSWLKDAGKSEIKVLEGYDLGRAVAQGASAFGLARQGRGIRIRGGVSHSYYLGVESSLPAVPGMKPPLKALCVASIGMEEGTQAEVADRTFDLTVGKKAGFNFFKSNSRREDQVGDLLEDLPEDVEETSGLTTTLDAPEGFNSGDPVTVTIQTGVTEVGTLEIYCLETGGSNRWKLQFNVRDAIK
jgi:molecular chaperone DnaK (HSP70)